MPHTYTRWFKMQQHEAVVKTKELLVFFICLFESEWPKSKIWCRELMAMASCKERKLSIFIFMCSWENHSSIARCMWSLCIFLDVKCHGKKFLQSVPCQCSSCLMTCFCITEMIPTFLKEEHPLLWATQLAGSGKFQAPEERDTIQFAASVFSLLKFMLS